MPDKDPTTWSAATWALGFLMASAGGAVNWYAKVRRGHPRAFNIGELIGEIFISGFVGMMAFMSLDAIGQPIGLCAAAAGVGGHMSTRLLFAVERVIESRFGSIKIKGDQ
ncbi:MAG: phage holin family protein [Nitrosomonas sp.]|nr:phage holin family protein [Nitrosomonas sp.]